MIPLNIMPLDIAIAGESPAFLGIRERSKLERRGRIVQAARAVFREKGFDASTTREVAEMAEVGAGTIFLYARDKRELLLMIVNDEFDALADRAAKAIPKDQPLVSELVQYFAPQLRFWSEDVELARLATTEMHAAFSRPRDGTPENDRFHDRRIRTFASLRELIVRAQCRGAFGRGYDAELAAHLIFDIHIGETRKWLSKLNPTYRDAVRRLREVLAFALQGFAVNQ